MIVKGIGVDLRRMSAVDAEQVRQWRNSSVLQSYLHHPKQISYEQQQAWFQTLDKERNYHFIIVYNGADVGFCSIKNLDVEQQSGEPGIFIVDENATQLTAWCGGFNHPVGVWLSAPGHLQLLRSRVEEQCQSLY
jgi:RimJ/RimL family protein N-acetyltransferase